MRLGRQRGILLHVSQLRPGLGEIAARQGGLGCRHRLRTRHLRFGVLQVPRDLRILPVQLGGQLELVARLGPAALLEQPDALLEALLREHAHLLALLGRKPRGPLAPQPAPEPGTDQREERHRDARVDGSPRAQRI